MNNVERFDELYNINTMTTQKGSFFRLQKILFEDKELKELSLGAKVLYAFMCDRIGLSVKNGWTDERGCIFIIYPVAEVCEKLGCKKDKARKILSELENFGRTGLIRRKKQGLGRPDKIFVVEIKEEVVEEMNNVVRFDEFYNINTITTQKGSFFRLQKILFEDEELKELSLGAKVLYAFMCDRIGLSVKNGWTDERGCIFIIYSVIEVCEKLGCKKDKARKILAELEDFGRTGLIRRKKQGLGRPDKIFVVEIKEEVVEEDDIKSCNEAEKSSSCREKSCFFETTETENAVFRGQKKRFSESGKTATINTNINKTELNKTNLINQDTNQGMTEGTEDYNTHKNAVRKKLEYDYLMQECAFDEQAHVNAMVEIITQVEYYLQEGVCIINKTRCPSHIVREQLAKVTRDHVEYVLENLRKSAPKITNIRNYLLSSLFNAVDMMDSHYSLQVRHEMVTGDMFARLEAASPDYSTSAEELQPWNPS